jgi:hypothetical protein
MQTDSCCRARRGRATGATGREAEALGVLDHHQAGVGHIDADLDHRGGHQHIDLASGEGGHHRGLFVGLEAAVHQADAQALEFVA